MEEGVLGQIKKSSIQTLFSESQYISSVSGSGNNWAVGYHTYGPQYLDKILESVRMEAEKCDSIQSFVCIHSLGGGTGSGLGSAILDALDEEYPIVLKFSNVVFPSDGDDVVISPYNRYIHLFLMIVSNS